MQVPFSQWCIFTKFKPNLWEPLETNCLMLPGSLCLNENSLLLWELHLCPQLSQCLDLLDFLGGLKCLTIPVRGLVLALNA